MRLWIGYLVAREEVGLMNVKVAFFRLGMHTENIAKKKWVARAQWLKPRSLFGLGPV